jgi:hypothetical protein
MPKTRRSIFKYLYSNGNSPVHFCLSSHFESHASLSNLDFSSEKSAFNFHLDTLSIQYFSNENVSSTRSFGRWAFQTN